jgi:hypothetical protein
MKRTRKGLFILTVFGLSAFCGAGASAEVIINPSFELDGGTLYWEGLPPTGWSKANHPSFGCDDDSHWSTDGQFSLHLYSYTDHSFVAGCYESIYQVVDLTGVAKILFDAQLSAYKLNERQEFRLFEAILLIDGAAYWSQRTGGTYIDQSINVSKLIGYHKLELRNQALSTGYFDTSYWTAWDNLRVIHKPVIQAAVDIEPDTLNLNSKGKWITCYIRLPEGYDIAAIDPDSVRLEEVIAADSISLEEQVAIVKFSRQDVQDSLEEGYVELSISGMLADGTMFVGKDVIRVIDKVGIK